MKTLQTPSRRTTRAIALTTGLAAIAAPVLLVATPANADVERFGTCAGARFELSVDRERGGFDVDAEIDDAAPGSAWRVTLRHNGKRIHGRVLTADADGDIEVSRWRRNANGKDTFALRVAPAGGSSCSLKITR